MADGSVKGRLDKAIDRGSTTQEKHAPCVVCGQDFDDCQHGRVEVDGLFAARIMQRRTEGIG